MVASNRQVETRTGTPARPEPLCGPVDEAVLQELARRIVGARPDACVMLFGSRARGDHREDSDLDLIVVTEHGERGALTVAGELYGAIGRREFPLDLVVMSPARFRERRTWFDPFMHDAMAQGRMLHGKLE